MRFAMCSGYGFSNPFSQRERDNRQNSITLYGPSRFARFKVGEDDGKGGKTEEESEEKSEEEEEEKEEEIDESTLDEKTKKLLEKARTKAKEEGINEGKTAAKTEADSTAAAKKRQEDLKTARIAKNDKEILRLEREQLEADKQETEREKTEAKQLKLDAIKERVGAKFELPARAIKALEGNDEVEITKSAKEWVKDLGIKHKGPEMEGGNNGSKSTPQAQKESAQKAVRTVTSII